MNKKCYQFLSLFMIFLIIFIFFLNIDIIKNSMYDTFTLFIHNVFPFLFFFTFLSLFLAKINIIKYFRNPLLYLFFMSIISGAPINSIIIKDFLDKNIIDTKKASWLICCTTFNNPLFLYNFGIIIFDKQAIVLRILLIYYSINIITFLFLYFKCDNHFVFEKVNIIDAFIECVKNSIINMLYIFAFIAIFRLICDVLMPASNYFTPVLKGFIELTCGLNDLKNSLVSSKVKELQFLTILLFNGFSIHMQIASNLSKYNINYKYFYLSKIGYFIFILLVYACKLW